MPHVPQVQAPRVVPQLRHAQVIAKVLGNLVVNIQRRLVVVEVPPIVNTETIHIGSLDQQLARVQRAPIQMVQEEQTRLRPLVEDANPRATIQKIIGHGKVLR